MVFRTSGSPAAERRARLQAVRATLQQQRTDARRQRRAFVAFERLLQPTLVLIDLADALGAAKLEPQWPWYLILVEHWPTLITANARASELFLDQSAADYDAALARIARLLDETE